MLRKVSSNKKSMFGQQGSVTDCPEEFRECEKHEIIVKISDMLGENPMNICTAEMIFDQMKYDIARYIVNHEYSQPGMEEKLMLWLEEKSSPCEMEKLAQFMDLYLKK